MKDYYSQTSDELIERALKTVPFPIDYNDWLRIGFALANYYGARYAAELLYQHAPPTKGHESETVEDYERKFSASDGRVNIGTLLEIAKRYGFQPIENNESENKYPLQKLNGNVGLNEDEPIEPSAAEIILSQTDIFKFDENLIPQSTIFEKVYRYYLANDIPPQFAFAGALATLSAIIGDKIKIEFADQTIKANDYFVLLAQSGGGKSTAIQPVHRLLLHLEKKIQHDGANVFLYPSNMTERALFDIMREASESEREKGINSRKSQTSGLLLNDEITSLFADFTAQYNQRFDATVLRLWDGYEITFATSSRLDGRIKIPNSALTILGASTLQKFKTKLPVTAWSDGLLARMNFIHANRRERARKPISSLMAKTPFENGNGLIDELLAFFQFICKANPIPTVTDCAKREDENATECWFDEQKDFETNEAIDAYYNRISVRMWKYAIILSACKAFEQRTAIVIDGATLKQARAIADYFKAQFIHFVTKNENREEKGLDLIGKAKLKIISLLDNRFEGEARRRELYRFANLSKSVFETALNELIEDKTVRLETRKNANGVDTPFVVKTLTTLTTLTTLQSKNLNATQTNQNQNFEVQCRKSSVVTYVSSEPTQPVPVPAPTPETVAFNRC
ncbi:MAG: DUF3987 domain-containing protein [Chloroherpetonaceae bacterium]